MRKQRFSLSWLIARLLRRAERDDGFTLIELMIASGIMATSLAFMASVLTSGLSATGVARERQSATGLANQVIEEMRALPMATLVAGMGSNDLNSTTDTSIAKSQNSTCNGTGTGYCFSGEPIKFTTYTTDPASTCPPPPPVPPATTSPPCDPLVPHLQTTTVGPTVYTVATYLTNYNGSTTSKTYRATTVVSWKSALAGNAVKSVQVQTVMYAPAIAGSGCNDPSVHPIPGPCSAGFTADAVQTPSSSTTTGTIAGLTLDHVTINGARATSDLAAEQVTTVKGVAQASGEDAQLAGQSVCTAASTFAFSSADNDPNASPSTYQTSTLPAPSSGSCSLGPDVNGNSITATAGVGDTGITSSATMANTTAPATPAGAPIPYCPNLSSPFTYPSPYTTNESDNLPCGASQVKTAATTTAQATIQTLGTVSLAAVVGGANPTTAITDIDAAPATGRCAATSGDGCVHAQLTRTGAPELDGGGLPANLNPLLKPANWASYLVKITGVVDSATAEAGVGSAAPSASETGSVKVYCGSALVGNVLCPAAGYVTQAFSFFTSTISSTPVTITDPALGGAPGTTITLQATITPGTTATTSDCSGTCTHKNATATSTPLTVSVTETITVAGQSVLSTTTLLNPGPITASASYVPPST